jgi:hypothetical protein
LRLKRGCCNDTQIQAEDQQCDTALGFHRGAGATIKTLCSPFTVTLTSPHGMFQ